MGAPPARAPTPRQDGPRPYGEPSRHTPVRKVQSPSPKIQPAIPPYGSGPQTLPQLNIQERPTGFPSVRPSPQMNGNGPQSSGPSSASNLPPYGRPFSPPSEIRPIRDDRPHSPHATYHQPPYHPPQGFPSIANGVASAAPPLPATAETPRDDRPPSAMKRTREWENEAGPSKKPANEETRARLDEPPRHSSPPNRIMTPREHFGRSPTEIQRENERRANENYHPSEAAHHPYSLAPQPARIGAIGTDPPKEERKEANEPAARKMDVDEDYDNNSEDDTRVGSGTATGTAAKNSPIQGTPSSAIPKQEIPA
jgi:general transcriptional corepressor CYC8